MEDPAGPAPAIISDWEISSVVGHHREREDMNRGASAIRGDIFQRRMGSSFTYENCQRLTYDCDLVYSH